MVIIETISYDDKVYAIIIRNDVKVNGVKFFTPEDYPFQVGIHLKDKGSEIKPHIHKPISKVIKATQEFLHIDYGKAEVVIYNENKRKIKSIILNSGDSMLAVRGGHGFKFLEETKIIEVKQGPYTGIINDKEKFNSV